MYDPSSQDKKRFLQLCLALCNGPPLVCEHELKCFLTFTYERPKSHFTSKGKLRSGIPLKHVYKPDADNLAKFVLDALNGTFYKDDSQIYQLTVVKRYGTENSVCITLQK